MVLRTACCSGIPGRCVTQVIAVAATIVYSGAASFVLLKIVGVIFPLRADAADESLGLDMSMHGEEAYVQAGGSGSLSAS